MKHKYLSILYLTILSFIIISCNNSKTEVYPEAVLPMEGTWVQSDIKDTLTIFVKADSLDANKPGFTFYKNGDILERKNAGWCGTPPISYANYNGTWKQNSDKSIEISVGYWGGKESFRLVYVSFNDTRTILKCSKRYYN